MWADELWQLNFGHAAAPSPCGRYLVAIKTYYKLSRLEQAVQKPAKMLPPKSAHDAQTSKYTCRLVHYDVSTCEVHAVLTGMPMQQADPDSRYDAYVHAAWQPWPEASLLYAWAALQGPIFLVDCHCHCVLARLTLEAGDSPRLTIQPRSELGTLDQICCDVELANLGGTRQPHSACCLVSYMQRTFNGLAAVAPSASEPLAQSAFPISVRLSRGTWPK